MIALNVCIFDPFWLFDPFGIGLVGFMLCKHTQVLFRIFMASQFGLFRQRKFTAMFFTQFLGAFNDNVFKQALLLLITYTIATKTGSKISPLTNLATMLFILPFFLFSAIAGQVADKYEKSYLTKKIKLLEIAIMVFAAVGFVFEIYWTLFLALFLMGLHSTFFGPIKYAYLPEVMAKHELIGANGLFQMGTSLAILTGMIAAAFLVQLPMALHWIAGTTLSVAVLGYLSAACIPKTHEYNPKLKLNPNIFSTSSELIKYLYRLPLLFFVVMGNSWFWFYGATFITQTPEFGKTILHGNASVVILLLTLFSVGTALGSLLCKVLTKNQVSLKLLPLGVGGLSLFTFLLYLSLSSIDFGLPKDTLLGMSELLTYRSAWPVLIYLFFLGFSGGIYIVPLYALMQAAAPASHRARVIGANNIFNALFMVGSALFAIAITVKLNIPMLFLISGLINLIFGAYLYVRLSTLIKDHPFETHGDEMIL